MERISTAKAKNQATNKNTKFPLLVSLVTVLFVVGCATSRTTKPTPKKDGTTKTPVEVTQPTTPTDESGDETSEVEPETPVTPPIVAEQPAPIRTVPRIGIIFSGGGAKAWAHIGVLKEIEKAKWPVHAVAGFEWGSAVAAIYGMNFSSNEVEWELSKVRDLANLDESSKAMFDNKSVAELKVPFVCPSLNVAQQSVFMLNRGQLNKLMPFCLAQPPLSKPYSQSVAEMDHIEALAQHLRSTGANKVILINVLAQKTKRSFTADYLSAENILWVKSAAAMSKAIAGVDDIIQINLDSYGINDLGKKREIIAKGSELSYNEIRKLTSQYGL
ncbi:patatin-like phospholipase family protein [Pseudobdellovibrio exovorus]|uniref:Alpha-beta hydrolase superfamily protein n=1 Tax=Pseudobdellovibrio exovorus JSS TaxID=1184267 RepID=M4VAW5_9BACT|nr:patatin-like phospholipase family protein [Pseudobdellovibrio exovorus]AGH96517.1 alpha-beta hydrolase superfamily protein [Pseudobdellovibrio exovorus JSS]